MEFNFFLVFSLYATFCTVVYITSRVTDICGETGITVSIKQNKQNKLHGLSPRANYADRATAACRGE
jgi:hypothetical protein